MQDILDNLQSAEQRLTILREVKELADLPAEDLRLVAAICVPVAYPRGAQVWQAEDVATDMVVIVEGALMPLLTATNKIPKGSLVGSVPLWAWDGSAQTPPRRSGTVTATTDLVLLRIPYSVVRPLMPKLDSAMARLFARYLADGAFDIAYR